MAKAARGYWQRTRRAALLSIFAWCILALGVQLTAQPLEAISIMGIPLSYYAGAQGILIGLVLIAFLYAQGQRRIDRSQDLSAAEASGDTTISTTRSVGRPRKGGLVGTTGALAMAGDWLSGATLVTLAGALYTFGHDGLSWLIGLFGGLVLAATLIAPNVHRARSKGVVDFIRVRFGTLAGFLALLIAALAMTLVLAANVQAFKLALAVLLPDVPNASEMSILVGTAVFLWAAVRAGSSSLSAWQAIAYLLIFAALTVPVVIAASGFVPGHFTFGSVMKLISIGEFQLLEKELADPVTLKVFRRPFTTATPMSATLMTLSLALGMAAMPNVLQRPIAARSDEGARLMPALAMLFILLAAVSLPPLAAGTRLAVQSFVGQSTDALPDRLLQLGALGLVDVCGVKAASQVAAAAACVALPDPVTTLRLDDVVIGRDQALFTAPLLVGLPDYATLLLAGAVALTSLLASAWLGRTMGAAAGRTKDRSDNDKSASLGSIVLAILAAAGAAFLVLVHIADVMTLLAWGLAIAAAGLAPALLAGVWSLRATAAGIIMGMLAGAGLTLYYIVATRYFAPSFYELWSSLSTAGYGAIAEYDAAREALTAASAPDEQQAAREAYLEAARAVANWWGLRDTASGVLGAAAGLVVLTVVSLVTPRPGADAVSLMSRMRGLAPGV